MFPNRSILRYEYSGKNFKLSSQNYTKHTHHSHSGNKIFRQLEEKAQYTKGEQYKCKYCRKSFARIGNLTMHNITHTGYKCDICEKRFTLHGNLTLHKKTHIDEKPNKCNVCDKTFSQSNILKSHMKIHTEKTNHMCDACGKGFVERGYLNKHKKVHTKKDFQDSGPSGEKPFKCGVCEKSFSYRYNCNRHAKIHIKEKSYGTDVCAKDFSHNVI